VAKLLNSIKLVRVNVIAWMRRIAGVAEARPEIAKTWPERLERIVTAQEKGQDVSVYSRWLTKGQSRACGVVMDARNTRCSPTWSAISSQSNWLCSATNSTLTPQTDRRHHAEAGEQTEGKSEE